MGKRGMGGRDNGLIQGKQCEPKLKRTDYPVRKAGWRNRQGSRGSRGEKMRKWGEKEGKKTYTRRYPCHGEVRRRGGGRSKETGPDCSRSLSSWGPYSGGQTVEQERAS